MSGSDDHNKKDQSKQEREEILSQLNETDGDGAAEESPAESTEIIRKPAGAPDQPEDLDSLLERIQESSPAEPTESMNVIQRLIGVVLYPKRVFEYLKQKPDIWTPLIIAMVIAVIASHLVFDIAVNEQFAQLEESGRLTAEQVDQQRLTLQSGPFRQIQLWVSPIIITAIMYFLIPVILLLVGSVILGGKASYMALTSIFGYSWVISYSLIGSIIGLPLIVQEKTLKIAISLAAFLPDGMQDSTVYNLLNAFDVPTVLCLGLLGLGFGIVYNFSSTKGILTVALTYLIVWVIPVRVLLASFLSQFGM